MYIVRAENKLPNCEAENLHSYHNLDALDMFGISLPNVFISQ